MRREPSGSIRNCSRRHFQTAKSARRHSKSAPAFSELPSAIDETRPVYLHSASDFFWGDKFANAQFIARWVTPHDPAVLQLVSSARNYVRRGRLAGYELPGNSAPAVAAQVEDEARGVFAAMEHLGLSYVDSISTYGNFTSKTERVRLPQRDAFHERRQLY